MGVHHDIRALGLTEDLRQPHPGQLLHPQQIGKKAARAHRRQLIRIAHQHQPGMGRQRRQQRSRQG